MACPPSTPNIDAIFPLAKMRSMSDAPRAISKCPLYFAMNWRAMSICSSWTRANPESA
jgi:hypothetical protein